MRAQKLTLQFAGVFGLSLLIITQAIVTPAAAQGTTYSTIERGRYLVNAGDCISCHTAQGGKSYAGGRAIPTPFGTIYSPNITPDKETGIGRWTMQDFYKAMHEGIDAQGKHLYPAFPYPSFTKVTRDDVQAIKAFLDTIEPVKQESPPNQLPWPLSWREVMAGWNELYFHEGVYKPNAGKSVQWNRGAYLVEGVGHCGACHTPRNALGAVDKENPLQGGHAEHWYAPSLAGDLRNGLGGWSVKEIVEYLRTGSTAKTAAAGPMTEVVMNSTRHLSNADLAAVATYLKDMPAQNSDQKTAILGDQALRRGQALYVDNCAGCHMPDGGGIAQVFPTLKGSSAIQAKAPATVIQVVLGGAKIAATASKPTGLAMPAFGWKLSDAEIADVLNYIRNAWGNRAPLLNADTVADLRKNAEHASAR